MQLPQIDAEIAALETRLKHFEDLLELSIKNNDVLAKTKTILQEVKKLSEKLNALKRLNKIK